MKIILPRTFPNFLVFLRYLCDEYGVRDSICGHICGRSKIVPKSIAIDQESSIRHFGIIKNPKTPQLH